MLFCFLAVAAFAPPTATIPPGVRLRRCFIEGTTFHRPATTWAAHSYRGAAATLLVSEQTLQAPALAPIWMAVLVQMLGVGVTLSTLPLFLMKLGGSANQLAITISVFSVAQMLGAPLLVALSGRVGRLAVLRACLAGNALASLATACGRGWVDILFARALAGFTAASVPVAQVADPATAHPAHRPPYPTHRMSHPTRHISHPAYRTSHPAHRTSSHRPSRRPHILSYPLQ